MEQGGSSVASAQRQIALVEHSLFQVLKSMDILHHNQGYGVGLYSGSLLEMMYKHHLAVNSWTDILQRTTTA